MPLPIFQKTCRIVLCLAPQDAATSTKIFLVNVGANVKHQARARSPIFDNDRFIFVSFPLTEGEEPGLKPYPPAARPFTRNVGIYETHADPDWDNLTYGDYTANGRAAALKRAALE